jgi:cyclic beta-1,2-glucan synthetase
MLTAGGQASPSAATLAVTRWREDPTRDHCGSFCYLRDVRGGAVWSAGYQPAGRDPQDYEVTFSEEKVEIRRHDVGLLTHTEVVVAGDNGEVRRLSITINRRASANRLTSYAEVVLRAASVNAAHGAGSSSRRIISCRHAHPAPLCDG